MEVSIDWTLDVWLKSNGFIGLAQFQAKESTDIPDEVYDKILIEMKKQRLLDKFITWNKLKSRTVVIKDVIVPGANLIVPIPKKVTNK